MDLQTLIIAMSIPSGVTAFCFWMIEQKIKKQQTEAEEKEKIQARFRGLSTIVINAFHNCNVKK